MITRRDALKNIFGATLFCMGIRPKPMAPKVKYPTTTYMVGYVVTQDMIGDDIYAQPPFGTIKCRFPQQNIFHE